MQARIAISLLRNKTVRSALLAAVLFVFLAPIIVFAGAVSVLSQSAAQACSGGGEVEPAAGGDSRRWDVRSSVAAPAWALV